MRWAAPEQFAEFVRGRHVELLRFAYLLCGDRHLAEDLVQDALERTGMAWRRLRRQEDPEGYVRRVVTNRYLNRLRSLRRERLVHEAPETGYLDTEPADDSLLRMLADLPRQQRVVLVMRYYLDYSEAQIADTLGCSAGTVKSTASRAIAKLRRQPCQLDRVESLDWIVQSAPWGPATGFALRPNFTLERCTLSGRPQLLGTNVATGKIESVPAVDLGPLDGSITRQFPATVDPGEMARVHIRGNSSCRADQQPQSYRDLVLVVDGKQLKVPEFRTLTEVCGADVSPWFVEPPMEYATLNVFLEAPTVLRRGEDFTYVVRVDNVYPRAFPMPTCPVYRLTPASDDEPWRRIHCSVAAIGAHSSIRFTLRGHIPADTALGRLKLTWMAVMSNGEAAIADMGTSGFVVTITE